MDSMNRSQAQTAGHGASSSASSTGSSTRRNNKGSVRRVFQLSSVALLFSATVLVVALVLSLFFGSVPAENKYVDKKTLQAVFLNNGQVYFGNIRSLNEKYVRLNNIYYPSVNQQLQLNQSTAASDQDIPLVKLGCEWLGPGDQILINRDQVTYWENLKTDGQVAKEVAAFVKANPTGQKCTTSTDSSSSTTTSTNSTTTTPSNTTNTNSSNASTNSKKQ